MYKFLLPEIVNFIEQHKKDLEYNSKVYMDEVLLYNVFIFLQNL